jgi:hypothetical protein
MTVLVVAVSGSVRQEEKEIAESVAAKYSDPLLLVHYTKSRRFKFNLSSYYAVDDVTNDGLINRQE